MERATPPFLPPNGKYLYAIPSAIRRRHISTAFPYDAASGKLGEALQAIGTVPDDLPTRAPPKSWSNPRKP